LRWLAERVGTPFYLYDAHTLRGRIAAMQTLTARPGLQARYAMKACSVRRVLEVMHEHHIWIDAVSGNEVLRAQAAGYDLETALPEVMLTTDVFRDNALDIVCRYGSYQISARHTVQQLASADCRGLSERLAGWAGYVQAVTPAGGSTRPVV
jgi:diaminopimelate decarboxylase